MITIKPVNQNDAPLLRHLATLCPPLDVHTPYTYWVMATYFGEYSFIAYDDGKPIGYIMNLKKDNTLFIWQIGIIPDYRKQGISQRLIGKAVRAALKSGCTSAQVTIAPENIDSYCAFKHYCLNNKFSFENISTAHITDLDDENFVENEKVYEIKF